MSKTFRDMKTKFAAQRQARSLLDAPLTLPKGEPEHCFENSIKAVSHNPTRLNYVEGFFITRFTDSTGLASGEFVHHAWVKDQLTGALYELTLDFEEEANARYIPVEDALYGLYIGKLLK